MSEERRQPHTQEPAEGADEDVEVPGAERPGDPSNPSAANDGDGEERAPHAGEPAEGDDEEVEEPGADRPENDRFRDGVPRSRLSYCAASVR